MTKPEPGLEQQYGRLVDSNAEHLVDTLFASLKVIFPASFSTVLKHPRDEATANVSGSLRLSKTALPRGIRFQQG